MTKKRVLTTSKEIYNKLNMLHLKPDIELSIDFKHAIKRIVNNINKQEGYTVINLDFNNDKILLKKQGKLTTTFYLSGKNRTK